MSNISILTELNVLDLALTLILLISGFTRYRLGLLQSSFKGAGYVAGGLLGLYLSLNYLKRIESILVNLLLTLVLMLFIAILFEYILGNIGALIHKHLLFAPWKIVDSILGLLLGVAKNIVIFYLIATVLLFSTFKQPVHYIKQSYFYTYLDIHLPTIITGLKAELDK